MIVKLTISSIAGFAKMEVLVFGSAIVDFISYVHRLPTAGETLHGTKFATGFGGKGANQCVAAQRLGATTALVAKLGDDAWGISYMEQLCKEGVNIKYVKQCKGETTGIAQIGVAETGENSIIIVVGANNLLGTDDIKQAGELFNSAKILICQLETPINATIAALETFRGISILNGAPAVVGAPKKLFEAASIFCVNESEAALMSGCKEITTPEQSKVALKKFLEWGAHIVIITLGPLGVTYVQEKEPTTFVHLPTPKVEKVVDTTGAGDAFIGSLAFYMARYPNVPLHQQIGAACVVAAYSVQYPGTQASFPNATQVQINLNEKKFDYKTF